MPVPPFRAYRPSLVALAVAAACASPVHAQLVIVPGANNPGPAASASGFGDGGTAGCYDPRGGGTIAGHVSMNMQPGEVVPGSYQCSTSC